MFDKEIDDAIAEIEKQQKALLEKMATKVIELEEQVKTMEILLAKFEIRHVTGEIDEETYQRENDLLSIGLDTAKNELEEVKEATNQLATGEFPLDQATERQPQETETPQPEVKFLQETAPEEKDSEPIEEPVVEAVTCTEVTATNSEVKTEEKQKA
jgi:hypothetical protein